jgi:hypothetical protein
MGEALTAGRDFLAAASTAELLAKVGSTIAAVPTAGCPDKRWFQRSFGRSVTDNPNDLLVGRGLFYLTEQRRLFLDCCAGHYQMTWGYDHPELRALLLDGIQRGIAWDNHSNIPAAPVKRLSAKLVELANPGADLGALGLRAARRASTVALIRTPSRRDGVTRAMALLGPTGMAGKRVVLKPNFNSADPGPAGTQDETLLQIVNELKKRDARSVTVGESSGPRGTTAVWRDSVGWRSAQAAWSENDSRNFGSSLRLKRSVAGPSSEPLRKSVPASVVMVRGNLSR